MLSKKNKRGGKSFWNDEYKKGPGAHLAISTNPSEDLEKFTRWIEREHGRAFFNPLASVLDLGCGNGRNLFFLAQTYGMRGVGYDISKEAIDQATKYAKVQALPLIYSARSIAGPIELADESQTLVLDMMTSHFLNKKEREELLAEIYRVLKPGGWFFFKTFLLDEDLHAERLLREHPASEEGSYIHPEIKVAEHVFTEDEIRETLGKHFEIFKIYKSHRHLKNGQAHKRRSVSVYAQKTF